MSIRKIFAVIAFLIVCIITVSSVYGFYNLNKVKVVNIPKDNDSLGISNEFELEVKKKLNKKAVNVDNILLLGIDKEESASDSMIIVSIDDDHKKLKLTSIMRDSYVDFKDKEVKKLNYAYHYGGPELAIKTINENYSLNIKDYFKVDFESLAKIIDAFGGVSVTILDYEIQEMSEYGINKSGTYDLTGEQAVGYCRIRHTGDADYERTQRQRRVLVSLIDKVRAKGINGYVSAMPVILASLETSMDKGQILELIGRVMNNFSGGVEQFRLPIDKQEVEEEGIFYLKWDSKLNIDALHKFIYED